MTLSESLQHTLESGFVVRCPKTELQIWKQGEVYFVYDLASQVSFGEWDEAFKYFITCYITEIQKNDTER